MRFLSSAIWLCLLLQGADLSKQITTLDRARDGAKLLTAASAIARSGDAEAMARLTERLGQRTFLRKLEPAGDISHLQGIFRVLVEYPSEASERLCITLASNAEFAGLPARMNLLLNALSAVRPLSKAGADVFRKTSRSGFIEVNGPLLAANGSPRALEVLEELLGDDSMDRAQRISVIRWSIVPNRTDADIIAMCARLLQPPRISGDIATALAESLFDYRPREWYGVRNNPPVPPAWSSATAQTKQSVRRLGEFLLTRGDVSDSLDAVIRRTLTDLQ